MQLKILHIDSNHSLLITQLNSLGYINDEDYFSSKDEIENKIQNYDGIVVRSRFKIDKTFITRATNLKFIARVGAGLENIDCEFAKSKNIQLIAAPEGNENAVGEHVLGMILTLFNRLNIANSQVKNGKWNRETNRGHELQGKTVGIIGYGHMGKSVAKKLRGFNVNVIFYDILDNIANENATQVSLKMLQEKADIVSIHTPYTPLTDKLVDGNFINGFAKPFWFINTARGKSVVTEDLVEALESGKILGAALDVLEYESVSFENIFSNRESDSSKIPMALQYLISADNVILTPHIAGWTVESHEKLAQVIVDKIKDIYT